jgi:hypothetical protein
MRRVSFLSALFSVVGVTAALASPRIPVVWMGDAQWLFGAMSAALAVMAFESRDY